MRETLLETVEDLEWLCEVHLKIVRPAWLVQAHLTGNEDAPESVALYSGSDLGDLVYTVTFAR